MAWIADNGLCDVCLFTRRQNKLVGLKRCFIRECDLLSGLITSFGLVNLYSWYHNKACWNKLPYRLSLWMFRCVSTQLQLSKHIWCCVMGSGILDQADFTWTGLPSIIPQTNEHEQAKWTWQSVIIVHLCCMK